MKTLFFSLILTLGVFSSIHIIEARTETGRTTWTNPTTNKTYIKVSYDDNYFALVDDGVLWNTAYLYNPQGQEVASKSNTSLEYTIKFVKESDSDGLIYRGEEIKKGDPLWGTTKNVVDILTTPTPTLIGQMVDGPDSFEKNSKTTTPITPSNTSPQTPPIQTPTNIAVLDSIVPSGIFNTDQPLSKILNQLFYIGLVAAVILAIVMIIRGGLEYMTVDAINSKESGKNRVKAALGGLLLAFSAILILNTINPGLTRLNIVFPMIQSVGPVSLGGGLTSGTRIDPATGLPMSGPISSTFTDAELEAYTLAKIKEMGFSNLSPADKAQFFPNGGTDEEWLALVSAMIKEESGFDPNQTYTENFKDANGNNVISTGLFQLSQESARGYGFSGMTTQQLMDPRTNIDVGLTILQKWVSQDGYISGPNNTGGARYWSVLRPDGKLGEVKNNMLTD